MATTAINLPLYRALIGRSVPQPEAEAAASMEPPDVSALATKESVRALGDQLARELKAGRDEARANAAASASKDGLRAAVALLATKEDVRAAIAPLASKDELRAEVAGIRAEIGVVRGEIAVSAQRQTVWFISALVAVAGLVLAIERIAPPAQRAPSFGPASQTSP